MGVPSDGLMGFSPSRVADGERRRFVRLALSLRPVRFVLVGGTSFGLVVVTFAALRLALPLAVAATLAYAVGALMSYELNRNWTFGLQSRSHQQIGRFAVITAAAMVTNAGLVQAIVDHTRAPDVAAEMLTLACIAPFTFLAYRHWGFAQPNPAWRS